MLKTIRDQRLSLKSFKLLARFRINRQQSLRVHQETISYIPQEVIPYCDTYEKLWQNFSHVFHNDTHQ